MTRQTDRGNVSPAAEAGWKPAVAVGAGAFLFGVLVIAHFPGINGPYYWQWPWRRIPAVRLLWPILAGMVPFGVAQFAHRRDKWSTSSRLMLLCLSVLLLQVAAAGIQSDPFRLTRLWQLIMSPDVTSYFTDAARLVDQKELLRTFPDLLPSFHLHSMNKPPGAILFHLTMIKLFGNHEAAALAGALFIALGAACVAPSTYWFTLSFGGNRDAAFHAASCVTLCTGLILFFPEFDQVYPVLTCGLLGFWVAALRRNRARLAVAAGLVFFLASFLAYSFLVLGAFLGAYTLYHICSHTSRKERLAVVKHLTLAVGAVVFAYLVLWIFARNNPFATFAAAWRNQVQLATMLARPYPTCVLFDLLDFGLGASWIPLALSARYLARRSRTKPDHEFWVVCFCLGQVLIVAFLGILRCETARVWLFMFPLVAAPAGLELARWSFSQRMVAFAGMAFLLFVVLQNMVFFISL